MDIPSSGAGRLSWPDLSDIASRFSGSHFSAAAKQKFGKPVGIALVGEPSPGPNCLFELYTMQHQFDLHTKCIIYLAYEKSQRKLG
jgi:hypothetical protein